MNTTLSKHHWIIGVSLLLVSIAVESAPPTLSGPNVIWFPHADVPFLQSEFVISNGKKHPEGGCTFQLASKGSPYPLLSGQHWITVQRAFDPDTCQELLERGVVDLNVNPEAKKLLEIPDSSSVNTYIQAKGVVVINLN